MSSQVAMIFNLLATADVMHAVRYVASTPPDGLEDLRSAVCLRVGNVRHHFRRQSAVCRLRAAGGLGIGRIGQTVEHRHGRYRFLVARFVYDL